MDDIIRENCKNSFYYFISFLKSKLNKELKGSIIDQSFLLKSIKFYSLLKENKKRIVIIEQERRIGVSTQLTFLSLYEMLFNSKTFFFISSHVHDCFYNTFPELFEMFKKYLPLNSISLAKNKNKFFITNKIYNDSQIQLISENFETSFFRSKGIIDRIVFDHCQYKNEAKLLGVLDYELNNKNCKEIIMTSTVFQLEKFVKKLNKESYNLIKLINL